MKVRDIARIVSAKVLVGEDKLDKEVLAACGADLMSDVMAFVKERVLLLTGLVNPQVIRTAELLDIKAICFVRGKHPSLDMLDMATHAGIVLAGTKRPMYIACGTLYEAGLRNGGTRPI